MTLIFCRNSDCIRFISASCSSFVCCTFDMCS
jgi:hypothetical protein